MKMKIPRVVPPSPKDSPPCPQGRRQMHNSNTRCTPIHIAAQREMFKISSSTLVTLIIIHIAQTKCN